MFREKITKIKQKAGGSLAPPTFEFAQPERQCSGPPNFDFWIASR